jgi:hypothetical protein
MPVDVSGIHRLGVAGVDCNDRHPAAVQELDEIGTDEPVGVVFHRQTPSVAGAFGASDTGLRTQPADEPITLEIR